MKAFISHSLFSTSLLVSACQGTASPGKVLPPLQLVGDPYEDADEPEHVPYSVETEPEPTRGTAKLHDTWWTTDSPCPPGSILFGGAPPEDTRVGCKTDKGKNVGRTTDFFESGAKKEEGQYEDHFAEGIWTTWDEEGHRLSETSFVKGSQEGVETLWYPQGEIKSQRHYKGGKRDGVTYIWDDRTRLRTALTYKNGVKDGPEARYSIEGDLARVIHWDEGKTDDPTD
jgi:antitoxin component YwqK of YwqJK toxin-antitoxin module